MSRWHDVYDPEYDVADFYDLMEEALMWERRAEAAKKLAMDLAEILKATRKRGKLSLRWNDGSAAFWHNLPDTWKDYILHG